MLLINWTDFWFYATIQCLQFSYNGHASIRFISIGPWKKTPPERTNVQTPNENNDSRNLDKTGIILHYPATVIIFHYKDYRLFFSTLSTIYPTVPTPTM
jgi:hypothetical protein